MPADYYPHSIAETRGIKDIPGILAEIKRARDSLQAVHPDTVTHEGLIRYCQARIVLEFFTPEAVQQIIQQHPEIEQFLGGDKELEPAAGNLQNTDTITSNICASLATVATELRNFYTGGHPGLNALSESQQDAVREQKEALACYQKLLWMVVAHPNILEEIPELKNNLQPDGSELQAYLARVLARWKSEKEFRILQLDRAISLKPLLEAHINLLEASRPYWNELANHRFGKFNPDRVGTNYLDSLHTHLNQVTELARDDVRSGETAKINGSSALQLQYLEYPSQEPMFVGPVKWIISRLYNKAIDSKLKQSIQAVLTLRDLEITELSQGDRVVNFRDIDNLSTSGMGSSVYVDEVIEPGYLNSKTKAIAYKPRITIKLGN